MTFDLYTVSMHSVKKIILSTAFFATELYSSVWIKTCLNSQDAKRTHKHEYQMNYVHVLSTTLSHGHEGDKLAKRPRGHVITGLLQIAVYAQTSFAVHRMNETNVTIELANVFFVR